MTEKTKETSRLMARVLTKVKTKETTRVKTKEMVREMTREMTRVMSKEMTRTMASQTDQQRVASNPVSKQHCLTRLCEHLLKAPAPLHQHCLTKSPLSTLAESYRLGQHGA